MPASPLITLSIKPVIQNWVPYVRSLRYVALRLSCCQLMTSQAAAAVGRSYSCQRHSRNSINRRLKNICYQGGICGWSQWGRRLCNEEEDFYNTISFLLLQLLHRTIQSPSEWVSEWVCWSFRGRVFPANHLAVVLTQTYNNQDKHKKPKDIHKKLRKLNLTKPWFSRLLRHPTRKRIGPILTKNHSSWSPHEAQSPTSSAQPATTVNILAI